MHHQRTWGLVSRHPRTCIRASKDLHQNIWGPASEHPDLHQDIQGSASNHPDLHQAIRTCIILPLPLRPTKEKDRKKNITIGKISKVNLIIDEIFISECTLSLTYAKLWQLHFHNSNCGLDLRGCLVGKFFCLGCVCVCMCECVCVCVCVCSCLGWYGK